uniref:Tyrosine-protein phosphatase domain-containing protein n=1 Tax=Ditylenchus dipsaci TaxID=166011 RepID=A0A915DHN7_9BILA
MAKGGQVSKLTFMISEIMATGASQQQLEAEVRLCCVIQVKMWPIENKVPCSTSALIDLIKMTRSWRKRAPDRPETKPTIVMSHNGVSRCGIFIGANVCIDQMDMDHEVDVFHAVKMIRLNRPQQLQTKDEYKYLYDLCLHYYMTNPDYRIHEPPEPPVQPYEDDYDEEVEERETTPASSGIISAIAGGLTRSRSSSRKGRTRSVRSRRSPTSTLNNCVVVKQPTMLVNNSNISPPKQKRKQCI